MNVHAGMVLKRDLHVVPSVKAANECRLSAALWGTVSPTPDLHYPKCGSAEGDARVVASRRHRQAIKSSSRTSPRSSRSRTSLYHGACLPNYVPGWINEVDGFRGVAEGPRSGSVESLVVGLPWLQSITIPLISSRGRRSFNFSQRAGLWLAGVLVRSRRCLPRWLQAGSHHVAHVIIASVPQCAVLDMAMSTDFEITYGALNASACSCFCLGFEFSQFFFSRCSLV